MITPLLFQSLISPEVANEAMRACGAFVLKVHELQRTIDTLVYDMKLFHAWMIFTILRLSHQEIPDDLVLTDDENVAMADFLCAMEPENDDRSDDEDDDANIISATPPPARSKFNLERVGQYLENTYLSQPYPKDPSQLWEEMVAENDCLNHCTLFVPHDKNLSLVQQRDKMFNAIDAVFHKPTESISGSFKLASAIICADLPPMEPGEGLKDRDFVTSSYYVNESSRCDMLACTISWQEAMILEISRAGDGLVRCTRVQLQPGIFTPSVHQDYYNLRFVDLQFYNESSLSMLAQSTAPFAGSRPHSYFVQFSLSAARNQCTQHQMGHVVKLKDSTVTHSIHDIIDGATFKGLDGVCEMLAISGSRKVATVLSDRKRKMTIFEMEIEEEEDDTEMSQASFLEISKESVLDKTDT